MGHMNSRAKADNSKSSSKSYVTTSSSKSVQHIDGWSEGMDHRIDYSGHYEFGGPPGVFALMITFPILMYYMFIGAACYNGKLPLPVDGQNLKDFTRHLCHLIYINAYPSQKAWTIYWTFILFQALFYIVLPGVTGKGKPLPHDGGKQLAYHCSGVWSFYFTLAIALLLEATKLFRLSTLIDEFGPLMSVGILSGFLVSIIAYTSALFRGVQHRMSGNHIYDFFMGAELNPRLFEILDFKMFFERIPWFYLVLLSCGAALRQYERHGFISGEIVFLVLAHFLYANAIGKGEQLIVPTWDMYYEKWGFMLIFWNLAGVPMTYCHCTLYLAYHSPSSYHWNPYLLMALITLYLFIYWVWDTTNSQKNAFRHQQQGNLIMRRAFPQLPWQVIKNPKVIRTDSGDAILADGWYGYARKLHYTCDFFFASSWGLITGFNSLFPWFYPVFFTCMIVHRAVRDIARCRVKYGKAWEEYEKAVPYLFIPYIF